MARGMAARLRSEFGACKQCSALSDGTGWVVELDCSKGRALTASIYVDHGVIDSIGFRPPQGTEMRCPTR